MTSEKTETIEEKNDHKTDQTAIKSIKYETKILQSDLSKKQKNEAWNFWWEKLGSPQYFAAPMVELSELSFRLLCLRHGAQVCYTPMLHASKFVNDAIYREKSFATCDEDRPLIVQFCANDAEVFARAAELVSDHCDGVCLNLGCPQIIAKRGHYGSYLQEEWDLLTSMVHTASQRASVPISCKIRVLPDVTRTVEYAQMLEKAGAKWITVHGRSREQKGHATGLADWTMIKAVKDNVSIPVVANGNILNMADVEQCLKETGVDAVMSAEGLLANPALFSGTNPPVWEIATEYLQLCKQYPTDHGHVRTHLFRMFANCLHLYKNLQEKLANTNSVDEMSVICDELKNELQILQAKNNDDLTKRTNAAVDKSESTQPGDSSPADNKVPSVCLQDPTVVTSVELDISAAGDEEGLSKKDEERQNISNETYVRTSFPLPVKSPQSSDTYVLPVWLAHARVKQRGAVKGESCHKEAAAMTDVDILEEKKKRLPRSEKKRLMAEKKLEGQRLRRKQTKQERKRRRDEEKLACTSQTSDESTEHQLTKRQRIQQIRERCAEGRRSGQRVCIDLSLQSHMTNKECSRLAQQLCRLYGSNRKAECPLHVYFSGLNKDSYLYKECLRKNSGFENYAVDMHEEPYTSIFTSEQVIYLSPDSPNVLQSVEQDKVYVIGGLVDETVQKGVSQENATTKGIRTARLPIDEYMIQETVKHYKKELAINQVFDILLEYTQTRDWVKALSVGLPPRHGFIPRDIATTPSSSSQAESNTS